MTAAARILFIALFVLAVLLYTAYSGNVVSLLSATGSVTSTQQQIINDKMKVGAERTEYFESYFKVNTQVKVLESRNDVDGFVIDKRSQ